MDGGEAKALIKTWWCRGGGAATVLLLVVVSIFRAPRDAIFWIALAFFVAHTALSVRRYLIERKHRTTATVLRHHRSDTAPARPGRSGGPVVFPGVPVNSLIPLKIPPKMPKIFGE